MASFLEKLRSRAVIGFVGGSDLIKIKEQLGEDCVERFDYAFSQNGLLAMKDGKIIGENSLRKEFSEETLQKFINFCMKYIAELEIPVKRGTFVEFRSGMLNISPIGRNCSQEERIAFFEYDKIHEIRPKMIRVLKAEFPDFPVQYSIGGQISFDVFPTGWDKTYCLKYLRGEGFEEIHFFGDKTYQGGNDYEIFESEETVGHCVTSPEDSMEQVVQVLKENRISL